MDDPRVEAACAAFWDGGYNDMDRAIMTKALAAADAARPSAPVVDDAMVEQFQAAMKRWANLMAEVLDQPVYTPSRENARKILTKTLTEGQP